MKKETQENILRYFEPYLSFIFSGLFLILSIKWLIQDSQSQAIDIALFLSMAMSFIGIHSYKKIKQKEEDKKS